MTVAAAYSIGGCPVLFADVMLTAPKSGRAKGRLLPTQPYAETLLGEKGLVAAAATRKAIIVSENLALAWSGDFVPAQTVVRRLKVSLSGRTITKKEIFEFLAEIDDLGATASCGFVGWVVEGTQGTCFNWSSSNPLSIDMGPEFVIGTGAAEFRDIYTQHHYSSFDGEESSRPPYELAAKMGSCLSRDWRHQTTTSNRFGYWYEAIFLGEAGFEYVPEVQFCACEITFDEIGNVLDFRGPRIVVQSRSTPIHTLIQTSIFARAAGGHVDVYLESVSDEYGGIRIGLPDMEIREPAEYQCVEFQINWRNVGKLEANFCGRRGNNFANWIRMSDGKDAFSVNMAAVFAKMQEAKPSQ
jgi:hypothetical protein